MEKDEVKLFPWEWLICLWNWSLICFIHSVIHAFAVSMQSPPRVCQVWFPLSTKTWGDTMVAICGQCGNGSQVQLFPLLTDFFLPSQEWLICVSILPFLLTVILHVPEIVCTIVDITQAKSSYCAPSDSVIPQWILKMEEGKEHLLWGTREVNGGKTNFLLLRSPSWRFSSFLSVTRYHLEHIEPE